MAGQMNRINEHRVERREHLPKRPKTLKSNDLFEGEKEICIEHNGALYRLKITRQDKLILNK